MTLHVENLNTLIAHLKAQPPERVNMAHVFFWQMPSGGKCGCIHAYAKELFGSGLSSLDIDIGHVASLAMPDGYENEWHGAKRYPAHRVIATLERLRDHYLATGEIVVDWGPERTEGQPWSAPRATEVQITPPALPAALTDLLSGVAQPAPELVREG